MTVADRQAVSDVLIRLGRLVDDREWERLTGLFTDQVWVDYTSLWGGNPETLDRNALIGQWRRMLSGMDATQHFIGNAVAELGGDAEELSAVANVIGVHRLANPTGGPLWTVAGTYEARLVRTADSWAISALTLRVAWIDGNTNIVNLAGQDA
jgi:hypothetical protein